MEAHRCRPRLFQGLTPGRSLRHARAARQPRLLSAIAIVSLGDRHRRHDGADQRGARCSVTELPVELRPSSRGSTGSASVTTCARRSSGALAYRGEGRSYDSNYSYPLYRATKRVGGRRCRGAWVQPCPDQRGGGAAAGGDGRGSHRGTATSSGRAAAAGRPRAGASSRQTTRGARRGGDQRHFLALRVRQRSARDLIRAADQRRAVRDHRHRRLEFDGLSRAGIALPTDSSADGGAAPRRAAMGRGRWRCTATSPRARGRTSARVPGGGSGRRPSSPRRPARPAGGRLLRGRAGRGRACSIEVRLASPIVASTP